MVSFPTSTVHDDDVDSTSMALWYLSIGRFNMAAKQKQTYRIKDDYVI
jgi:phage terminase large subunit-like protein